jgi:hypothetical protein
MLTRTVPGPLDGGELATDTTSAVAGTDDGSDARVHAAPWLVLRNSPVVVAASQVSLTPLLTTTASPVMFNLAVGDHVAPKSVLT